MSRDADDYWTHMGKRHGPKPSYLREMPKREAQQTSEMLVEETDVSDTTETGLHRVLKALGFK